MKKSWKTMAVGSLLMAVAFTSYGAASADTVQSGGEALSAVQATPAIGGKPMAIFMHTFGLLDNPVHERKYLQMLVQAHAPESAGDWKAALDERQQVESQMPKPETLAKKMAIQKPATPGEGKAGNQVSGPEEPRFQIELSNSVLPTLPVPPLDAVSKDDILNGELPPELKLQDDFAKAVEADNDATIKELLPKLLENYKKQTAELKIVAEKMKQAKQEQSESESK
jgi:hypothetical protein